MKKRKIYFAGIVSILFFITLCFYLSPSANAKEIILKASTHLPIKHALVDDGLIVWGKEIEKRTNGLVKIDWYFASTLVPLNQAYDALRSNMVDLSIVSVGDFPNLFPVSVGIGLPFVAENSRHAVEIFHKMREQIPEIEKEWSQIKLIHIYSSDALNFNFSDKHVTNLSDFNNVTVGSVWKSSIDILKNLPCQTVRLAIEDLYMSLQRKTVDGLLLPDAAARAFKITDVTKTHTFVNIAVMPLAFAMSKKAYDRLPADVKKIFDEITPSFSRLVGVVIDNYGISVRSSLKKRGDSNYYIPDKDIFEWKKLMAPLYDDYVKQLNGKGYNGQAILQKLQHISDETRGKYYKEIDPWWKQGKLGMK